MFVKESSFSPSCVGKASDCVHEQVAKRIANVRFTWIPALVRTFSRKLFFQILRSTFRHQGEHFVCHTLFGEELADAGRPSVVIRSIFMKEIP